MPYLPQSARRALPHPGSPYRLTEEIPGIYTNHTVIKTTNTFFQLLAETLYLQDAPGRDGRHTAYRVA
jgi:hypothetical protein